LLKDEHPTTIAFTNNALHALDATKACGNKRQREFTDLHNPNLKMVLYPSNRKTFFIRTFEAGRKHTMKIGTFPEVSLATAYARVNKILDDLARGIDPRSKNRFLDMRVEELTSAYLEATVTTKKSSRTDASKVRNHITPMIGAIKVMQLSAFDIKKYLNDLSIKKLQVSTINRHLALIKSMMNFAVELEIIEVSPAKTIKFSKETPAPRACLDKAECIKFITHADEDINIEASSLLKLLSFTGLRLGEGIGLEFKHYNSDNSTIYLPETKSGYGRLVPLNTAAKRIIDAQLLQHGDGYVFKGKDGVSVMHNPRKVFKRICDKAGLHHEGLCIHSLRHSFVSLALAEGVSMFDVSKLVGHFSIKTTELYAHATPVNLVNAANCVGDVLSPINI